MSDAANRFRETPEETSSPGMRRPQDGIRPDAGWTESDIQQGMEGKNGRRSLEVYLDEVEAITPLPESEELCLFRRAAGGDREAANALIELYLGAVCDLVSEYEKTHQGVETEDLVQEANTGLVLGVAALQQEEEVDSLAAYRARLLNHVMSYLEESVKSLEEVKNSDSRIVNRMNQLLDTIRELEAQLSHKPSIEELSVFLDLPEEDIRDLLRLFPEG